MNEITKWNPLDEFQRIRDDMNRLMGSASMVPWADRTPFAQADWGPSVDVKETDTDVIVSAEIPGVSPDDLDITVTEEGVSIRGEIKHEANTNEKGYHRIERRYGSFQRTIPFPVSVKHQEAAADYRNGILEVKVPKAEPGQGKAVKLKVNNQPKQIQ